MKELKINDYKGREFVYNSDKDKRIGFSIEKPDKLYKYCSLDKFKIEQLRDDYFYLSHPNQLNDVLDGNPNLWDFSNIDINDYAELVFLIKSKFQKEPIDREKVIFDAKCEFEELKGDFSKLTRSLSLINSYCYGMYSLSENFDNNLMWAHYSGDDGFVVELSTECIYELLKNNTEEKGYLFPINYQNELEVIDIKENSIIKKGKINMFIPILYYFSVKSKSWHYENEWRILVYKNGMGYVKNPVDINYTKNLLEFTTEKKVEMECKVKNNRRLKVDRDIISKIILGPNFFSNKHFVDFSEEPSGILNFTFKDEERNNAKELFQILSDDDYSNKIYQLDIRHETFKREICYKIEIEQINQEFVRMRRVKF